MTRLVTRLVIIIILDNDGDGIDTHISSLYRISLIHSSVRQLLWSIHQYTPLIPLHGNPGQGLQQPFNQPTYNQRLDSNKTTKYCWMRRALLKKIENIKLASSGLPMEIDLRLPFFLMLGAHYGHGCL